MPSINSNTSALYSVNAARKTDRDMDTSMQSYQLSKVGPQGEFTRKQQQLEFDLMNQIKEAVDKVAIDGGFDLILDGSSSSLYTKPTLNITDSVLTELRS